MKKIKSIIRSLLPKKALAKILPLYHKTRAFIAAQIHRNPSREIILIGVTGTKGKTTTTELIATIFEKAGYKTAVSNSLRFKVGHKLIQNKTRNSMPGPFVLQKLIRDAVSENCDVFIFEMTSEGSKQFRHLFLNLDAFMFLNIAPEHIESHGSFEAYLDAKISLATSLFTSKKKRKVLLLNKDFDESKKFLTVKPSDIETYTFSLSDAEPFRINPESSVFRIDNVDVKLQLPGEFNIKNATAASAVARIFDIDPTIIRDAISEFKGVKGRLEKVETGEDFDVYVDYAHTPDSFEAIFKSFPAKRIVAVFGSAGGGRDTWKRPVLGKIADNYASEIIVTTEDPYDEDPKEIMEEISAGIKSAHLYKIEDRREAIRKALHLGRVNTVILLLGKGSEAQRFVGDQALEWNEVRVVKEELERFKLEKLSKEQPSQKIKAQEKVFTKKRTK